jgi:CheY-like chemotaxis protein
MDSLIDDLKELDIFIGRRLREKRRKLGFTLVQVGESLNISHQQIQKYEQAQSRVSAVILYRIAQFYGEPPQYFYQGFIPIYSQAEKRKTGLIFHNPRKTLHILLVEDDPADELVMRRALEETNRKISVFCVRDGDQTIDFLRYKRDINVDFPRPDLILLDLSIPKRDGFNVLKEIKRDRFIQSIPVVVLTNGINTQEMSDAYQNHASGYLCKSSDYNSFQINIHTLLNYWSCVVVLPGTAQEGCVYEGINTVEEGNVGSLEALEVA